MEMEYNTVAMEEKIETEYATVKKSQLDLVRQLDELTENARSTQRYVYKICIDILYIFIYIFNLLITSSSSYAS